MKIVFFGTPEFAATCLKELAYTKSIEILAVVTQPDKTIGRHREVSVSEVKQLAEKLKIEVLQPKSKEELIEATSKFKADCFVVIAYGMILPNKVLKIPKFGCINVHASLLPMYRGASPIQESLLNGDEETGISIMDMDEKLDHGPVYLIKRVPILKEDNFISLSKRLAEISSKLLPHTLEDIASGIFRKIPQDEKHKKPTFCHKIEKSEGEIHEHHTAKQIINMIRAYTPWPSVYTKFQNKRLKILEAEMLEEDLTTIAKANSLIIDKGILKLVTKNDTLALKKIQLEGKKENTDKEFINGNSNKIPKT